MIGNPAAAYLGGGLQQQLPTVLCGHGGPAITLMTVNPACFPTHHPALCWPPRTFTPLHCSLVCGDLTVIPQTLVSPGCLRVPADLTEFPGPGPLQMMAAGPQQADCKNVMWTAGCTFAAQQQAAAAECKDVLWTAGCTFAGAQQAQAGCKDVLWTAGCTFAAAQQGAAGCKDVLWTAGCTFAGAEAKLPQTLLPPCNINVATAMTQCFICPPNPCRQIFATRLCTLVAEPGDLVNARAGQDCKNVMWTAGCTFAGAQPAAAADCGKVLTTLACTLAAAKGEECGNVLTTLVCTLAKAGTADSPMCVTVLTHVPTWCQPDTGGGVGCKHVLWTAGCTFAGQQAAAECGDVLTTLVCTLAAAPGAKDDAEQCGNVLTTLACTLSADKMPGAEGGMDCKDVLWTAGCTFAGLAKGERCGDVLTTLACTLAAAPVEGQVSKADCKDVLWTAGCTFAVAPSERDDGCKVVAWTAGCTF